MFSPATRTRTTNGNETSSWHDKKMCCAAWRNEKSPRIKREAQLTQRCERNSTIGPCCQRVRSNLKVCTDWTHITKDSKLTVLVTACLGAQLLCKQKSFIGTTKQNEKNDTSAGTTPTITQGETLGLKQTKFVCSLFRVQDTRTETKKRF